MAIVRAEGFDAILRRLPPKLAAILIYGSDAGAVRELAKTAVTRIAGSLDDPFNVVRLEETVLAADQGRLADEFGALSMMGGSRAVWVTGADAAFLKSVEPLLAGQSPGSLIVAEASILAKASKLRTLFEKSERAIIVPVYEDGAESLHELIDRALQRDGLTIEADARARLASLLGADRALSRQEIEKLALYCLGNKTVRLEDVEAVSGDASAADTDDIVDAVFGGDGSAADRWFTALTAGTIDAGRIVSIVLQHAARLQGFKIDIDKGQPAEALLRAQRPPIFFKRHAAIQAQLRIWDLDSLLAAGATVSASILQMRQYPALAEAIANRALLALARNARALQQQR